MIEPLTFAGYVIVEYFWYWITLNARGLSAVVTRDFWIKWAGRRHMYVLEEGLEPVLNI